MPKKHKKREVIASSNSFENVDYALLSQLYSKLKEQIEIIEKSTKTIPLSVFTEELSCLETIVKYLKENLKLEFKEIGVLLGRSVKTLWQAYNYSKKKHPAPLVAEDFSLTIPISLFKDRRFSVLEHIVYYLKNKGMKFSEISRSLKRNPRTIWTVHKRARTKLKE